MEDSPQNNIEVTLAKLRKVEFQQRAILDNIPDIAWLKDVQGRFIAVNEPFASACGFKIEEIIGKTDLDIWPRDLALSYRADDQEVMDSKKRKCVQERLISQGGEQQWIETVKTPFFDDQNKVIGTTGIARNITLLKNEADRLKEIRAELELRVKVRTAELASSNEALRQEIGERKKIEEEIQQSLSLQNAALDGSRDGILVVDSNGKIVSRNRSFLELWRIPDDLSLTASDQKLLEYVLDQLVDSKGFIDEVQRLYNNPKEESCDTLMFKDGRVFERFSVPQKIKNKIVGRVWSFRDVTQNKKYENELKAYHEKLEFLVGQRTELLELEITSRKKTDEELQHYRNDLEKLVGERTQELLEEANRYKAAELEKSKLNRELIKINKKLKSVSLIDAHTGLYNYRYLQEAVEVEFQQARRYAQNLAIIMLDVDYFKSINDVYGIVFGDLVLKQLAKQLKRMVRRYDILIRYSGEEFIIISPRLNRVTAFGLAQRLLDSLNFINFGNSKHSVKLKMSLSVVSFPDDQAKNGMDLVNLANLLLNKAKESGGNRAYSCLDVKNPHSKEKVKISKIVGIKTLKNTIDKLTKQSKQGLSESIFAFAKTLELKDHYTGEHVENTVRFATGVAQELNLPKEDVELIKQAAMLHDLGKIGISESILLKKGKLDKKEFNEIKKHPQIGADIIRPIQFLHDLIPFIFYHHERWDGKGYPAGIKGEDIPLGARVIAIADVYQALISDRPYHRAFTKSAAIDIIKKASGTQFDPRVVSAFLKVVSKKK